jgi:hypothetical protein
MPFQYFLMLHKFLLRSVAHARTNRHIRLILLKGMTIASGSAEAESQQAIHPRAPTRVFACLLSDQPPHPHRRHRRRPPPRHPHRLQLLRVRRRPPLLPLSTLKCSPQAAGVVERRQADLERTSPCLSWHLKPSVRLHAQLWWAALGTNSTNPHLATLPSASCTQTLLILITRLS